jgi:restriction endonuclease S subunit
LNSIDTYILNELGITIPEVDASLENRLFFTSFKDVTGNRLDPYYKLYFSSNYRSVKYDSFRLGSITNICKGMALTSKDIIPGNIPVIAGGKSSPYSHNEANFDGNVITVSASGAYAGYVWYHQNSIFATDCSVISSKDESLVLTSYIAEVLKSIQSIIYRLQVGAAQPHVYPSDLMNIYIPSIPISQQKTIVNKALSIRDVAKKIIEEGNSILENAKKEVEQMILG